jgi:hypothetical protein
LTQELRDVRIGGGRGGGGSVSLSILCDSDGDKLSHMEIDVLRTLLVCRDSLICLIESWDEIDSVGSFTISSKGSIMLQSVTGTILKREREGERGEGGRGREEGR